MLHRLIFLLIAAFWITMNVWLWRTEFSPQGEIASRFPATKVWEKILNAPEVSALEITHRKKKIGSCRWVSRQGEERAKQAFAEDYQPENAVAEPGSYTLELEGDFALPSLTNNLRFDLTLKLSTNQSWQEFYLRLSMRPNSWEISSKAAEESVRLKVNDESGEWEQEYSRADLENPEALLEEFAGPLVVGMVKRLGWLPSSQNRPKVSLGLQWEAGHDVMRFGHSKVRVYRLEAKLLDRLKIYIFASRIGEILWVELPGELILSNNTFEHF